MLNPIGVLPTGLNEWDLSSLTPGEQEAFLRELFEAGKLAGVFHRLASQVYHDLPGLSCSGMDLIGEYSAAHYASRYIFHEEDDDAEKKEPHFSLGSLIHKAILEPDDFFDEYALCDVTPKKLGVGNRNAKVYKEAMAVWTDDNAGKQPCSEDQWKAILRLTKQLQSNPGLLPYMTKSRSEVSFFAVEPTTGALVKCRWDSIRVNFELGYDLKTSRDARAKPFERASFGYRYHVRAAWYPKIVELVTGVRMPEPMPFVVVEPFLPFEYSMIRLDAQAVEQGYHHGLRAIADYAVCLERGKWPGYPRDWQTVGLPRYGMDYDLLKRLGYM